MRAIQVSDTEAKLFISMKELNICYQYGGRHFICGVLISALGGHLKLKSLDPEVNLGAVMYYSDVFDWDVTTKSFHDQWVEYIGADSSHWDSYFHEWNKGTKYACSEVGNYNDGVKYRNLVLGECAEADPEYEFCIDMKINGSIFNGCIRFDGCANAS